MFQSSRGGLSEAPSSAHFQNLNNATSSTALEKNVDEEEELAADCIPQIHQPVYSDGENDHDSQEPYQEDDSDDYFSCEEDVNRKSQDPKSADSVDEASDSTLDSGDGLELDETVPKGMAEDVGSHWNSDPDVLAQSCKLSSGCEQNTHSKGLSEICRVDVNLNYAAVSKEIFPTIATLPPFRKAQVSRSCGAIKKKTVVQQYYFSFSGVQDANHEDLEKETKNKKKVERDTVLGNAVFDAEYMNVMEYAVAALKKAQTESDIIKVQETVAKLRLMQNDLSQLNEVQVSFDPELLDQDELIKEFEFEILKENVTAVSDTGLDVTRSPSPSQNGRWSFCCCSYIIKMVKRRQRKQLLMLENLTQKVNCMGELLVAQQNQILTLQNRIDSFGSTP